MVLPPSTTPATAATRPLIAAEPMLRAPRPEIVPASNTGWVAGAGAASTDGVLALLGGPATTAPATLTLAPGKWNSASDSGTLISAQSSVIFICRGLPCSPLAIENGIHMPPTFL